jgi:hypothetical protein
MSNRTVATIEVRGCAPETAKAIYQQLWDHLGNWQEDVDQWTFEHTEWATDELDEITSALDAMMADLGSFAYTVWLAPTGAWNGSGRGSIPGLPVAEGSCDHDGEPTLTASALLTLVDTCRHTAATPQVLAAKLEEFINRAWHDAWAGMRPDAEVER